MVLEFYYDLLSQPSRAVYIFLKVTGVPFEAKVVDLRKGEHLKPEYIKKNPFHKVPFIIDDGFMLSESAAIMRYIAGKYKVPEHWYPVTDIAKSARVLEYICWHPMAIRKPGIEVFIDRVKSRLDGFFGPKRPSNEKMLEEAKATLTKSVGHLEDYFLKDKAFIAGDDISIADLLCVSELMQLRGVNETALYESNAVVKAWVKRVEDKTNPYFEEALVHINDTKDRYSKAK